MDSFRERVMRVLTVATHSERWFPGFVESCRRQGLPLDVLGWGQRWRGFSWRFELYKQRLAQLPLDELVLITDAFDTIMLTGAAEIEWKFQPFGSDIVFSSEPTTYRVFEWLKWSLFGDYNGRVVNGGTYIGKAGPLLAMMQELNYSNDTDDQELLTAYCKATRATVDLRGDLFLHYLDVFPSRTLDSVQLVHGRFYTWPDDAEPTCPILITVGAACNGPRQLLLQLGYDESLLPYIPQSYRWKKVQMYFPTKWVLLIVFIVFALIAWRRRKP